MKAIHPDEAALLRSVLCELPERRQADLQRHVARCRPCRKSHEATKRLHGRLLGAGDCLAFSADDPFERRPAPCEVRASGRLAAKSMLTALARLAGEKQRITFALGADASVAATALDLDDSACRLAAAHVLEEAVSADPSSRLADFATGIVGRDLAGGIAEAVLPGAQLRALAHLVLGNWRLFTGRKDEATEDFRDARAALGAFDAPEHLCAWVEVGESLRRSYEGRAVEGRLLAERALETFERYGLGRGLLRARHAHAVALYTVSEFREAYREFQAVLRSKDATGLDRARAVSGAAFCLAARGRFHEAAKEYSRVRRKLKGEGAMAEQYLLQGEMKVALGTAGRWHPRRGGLTAFALPEAGGAFHARQLAAEIVRAVSEEGLEKAKELLGKIEAHPSRGYAHLYACQLAMPKVSSDPAKYVEFTGAMSEAAREHSYPKDESPAQTLYREQALGEAAILESTALTSLGKPAEGRRAAQKARAIFVEANEDNFALALASFFEGSAASFTAEFPTAWKLLRVALREFRLYGQENWQGRAEAAVGTLLANRGKAASALTFLDEALRNLHPERDAAAYAPTLTNRGYVLARMSRLDAAKATYAKALMMARRFDMRVSLLTIRYGLASIEFEKGNWSRALAAFERLSTDAGGIAQRVLSADLRVAECLGRLGREAEMLERVERLRMSSDAASVKCDPGLRDLFDSLDGRSVSYQLLSHVARFAEACDQGARTSYKPFRLVKSGG